VEETSFLGSLALRSVSLHHLEQFKSSVFVERPRELVDGWRDLEAGIKDSPLSLKLDIFWPFNEARHISGRLDVSSYSKIFNSLLEEGILFLIPLLLLDGAG